MSSNPPVPNYFDVPALGSNADFAKKAHRATEISIQIKALKAELDDLKTDLGIVFVMNDVKSAAVGDFILTYSEGRTTRTVDRKKLVELGVEPSIIEQATKVSVSAGGISIRAKSESGLIPE